MTVVAVLPIHIWIHVACVVTVAVVLRYTYGYTWQVCDSGYSACDTHRDTRCLCVYSGCSAGDTHMDTRGEWVTVAVVLRYTYEYTWRVGDSGCSTCDTHMDTRGQWVTVAVVLRYTYGYTWPV